MKLDDNSPFDVVFNYRGARPVVAMGWREYTVDGWLADWIVDGEGRMYINVLDRVTSQYPDQAHFRND